MQLIESSYGGVRAAVYHMRRPGSDVEFRLFPMVHVGEPKYYVEISERLKECDLILAEGVRSRWVATLTAWYQVVKHTNKLGLVTQGEALDRRGLSATVVNADMSGEEFDSALVTLPWRELMTMYLAVPILAIYLYFFGTRANLAKRLQMDDLPSREETLGADVLPGMTHLIVDRRDAHLLRIIEDIYEDGDSQSHCIAVVYGAAHMRAVMGLLMHELGYRVSKAEWVTIFDL